MGNETFYSDGLSCDNTRDRLTELENSCEHKCRKLLSLPFTLSSMLSYNQNLFFASQIPLFSILPILKSSLCKLNYLALLQEIVMRVNDS